MGQAQRTIALRHDSHIAPFRCVSRCRRAARRHASLDVATARTSSTGCCHEVRLPDCISLPRPAQSHPDPFHVSFIPSTARGGRRRAEQGSTAEMWSVALCCPRCLGFEIINT